MTDEELQKIAKETADYLAPINVRGVIFVALKRISDKIQDECDSKMESLKDKLAMIEADNAVINAKCCSLERKLKIAMEAMVAAKLECERGHDLTAMDALEDALEEIRREG